MRAIFMRPIVIDLPRRGNRWYRGSACPPVARLPAGARPMRRLFILAFLLVATAARAEETVDYTRQIKPLLKSHCYSCHGALKQQGNLRLDTAAAMLKGGDGGPSI